VLGRKLGQHLGQLGAFGCFEQPEVVGQPPERRLASAAHVFWLHTKHSRDNVVLDVAAEGKVQQCALFGIGFEKRPPNFAIPG